MIKWFAYIALLLIFAPCFLAARIIKKHKSNDALSPRKEHLLPGFLTDTTKSTKKQEPDDGKKIKEIAKAKKQPKPEKIETVNSTQKQRPKRQRRPEGLERPPEIPRRNGN
jgi:hypothetical protein